MKFDLQEICLARRKTVLFVMHSTSEAALLADRVLVMSPRPGRIAADLAIDLPRPRYPSVRESPAFGAYASRIRALFEGWGHSARAGDARDRAGNGVSERRTRHYPRVRASAGVYPLAALLVVVLAWDLGVRMST